MNTARSIQSELKKAASKEYAKQSGRFFKLGKGEYGEGDIFLGISVPKIREVVKSSSNMPLTEAIKLVRSKYHEERLAGLIVLVNQYHSSREEKRKAAIFVNYVKHFKYINNWDLVDLSCYKIVGPHLEKRSRQRLYRWAKSKHLWTRRIAIVSTFHFIRLGELNDTYAIAKVLLHDSEDLMHKAVGWMLRECGKKDVRSLETFLKQHYQQMPRTMLRYAIERFSKPRRQQYLKGQV